MLTWRFPSSARNADFPFAGVTRLPAILHVVFERAISSPVSSAASSGSRQTRPVDLLFTVIGSPHTYYSSHCSSLYVDHHHHASAEKSDTEDSLLTIALSVIDELESGPAEDQPSIDKIQLASRQRTNAFRFVPRQSHIESHRGRPKVYQHIYVDINTGFDTVRQM